MAKQLKTIGVYCGHEFGNNPVYARAAKRVGELLCENKLNMIFGAGNVGLMGQTATAAISCGLKVIGVSTPTLAKKQEPPHDGADVIMTETLNERKQIMFDKSDAFIIMPGGTGTIDELTEILTKQQIGETKKPVFFLNTNKFWAPFGDMLLHMHKEGFIANMDVYNIYTADTPEELIEKIKKY